MSPCWDTVCRVAGIEWGDHKIAESVATQPAGKALNISRALAWMGQRSMAAGLWGRDDFDRMHRELADLSRYIKTAFTRAPGPTRRNVTMLDTANRREMHLRSTSHLASVASLKRLAARLRVAVRKGDVCVFAGSMPGPELAPAIGGLVRICKDKGAKIAVDTSGPSLKQLVENGVWMIKPNVDELCELLGREIPDRISSLRKAAEELLEKVRVVLISRGPRGAILVTKSGCWSGRCSGRQKVLSTVGCGDYLLAGFLKGLADRRDYKTALETALKTGTAKARGLTDGSTWVEVERALTCEVKTLR